MQAINKTLKSGQAGSEVANLQEILMYFISSGTISIPDYTLVNGLGAEYAQQLYGSTTRSIVQLYQAQHNDNVSGTESGEVTEATLESINETMDGLPFAESKILTGAIRTSASLPPAETFTVTLYQATLDGRNPIAFTNSDTHGRYRFAFGGAGAGKRKGYQAEAISSSGETYSSAVTYLDGEQLQLDIILPEAPEISEYEAINTALTAALSGDSPADVNDEDDAAIAFLVNETGERADYIRLVIRALHAQQALGNVSAEALYAFLRHNISVAPEVFLAQPADLLRRAIVVAIAGNIIPGMSDAQIEVAISGIRTAGVAKAILPPAQAHLADPAAIRILQQAINNPEKTAVFLGLFYEFGMSGGNALWNAVRNNADLEPITEVLQAALPLAIQTQLEDSAVFRILQLVLNDAEKTAAFLRLFYESGMSGDDALWDAVANKPALAPHAGQLKTALSLAILTSNNPAIVNRLLHILANAPMTGDPDIDTGSDPVPAHALTALALADWEAVVSNAESADGDNFFYPNYITGSGAAKTASYAQHLRDTTRLTYPTQAIALQVAADTGTPFTALRSKLPGFLDANPDFDFRTTPVTALEAGTDFNFEGIGDSIAVRHFIAEIGTVQRLMHLTGSYDVIATLATQGYTSSLRIVQQSQQQFVSQVAYSSGQSYAMLMYSTAQSVTNYSLTALLNTYSNAVGGAVFNNSTQRYRMFYNPTAAYAEWRTLFGSLDSCDCCQCQSVYSASAYMTDLLHFLKTNLTDPAVHNQLINTRRPDLLNIELSCKNANTPVPQIDIVNEILEDLVSPATAGGYAMYARQTVADAATQRAIPEYINTSGETVQVWDATLATPALVTRTISSPYPSLIDAKYPWSLPYNFYKRQIDTHLGIAGVKGHEIVQRFSQNNKLDAWDDYAFCLEYLGILKDEADIITTVATSITNDAELLVPYGFKYNSVSGVIGNIADPSGQLASLTVNPVSWVSQTIAQRVDIFLQQTGLGYSDLLQLLDCFSINPFTNAALTQRMMEIVPNASGVLPDTCRLNELEIDGMTADVLRILHRFVRLKRALGWTYYELDRALISLGITTIGSLNGSAVDEAAFKQLVQLKYLAGSLKISVEDATILFTAIDNRPYRDYTTSEPKDIPSLYERIFRNPAVSNVNATDYPFPLLTPASLPFSMVTPLIGRDLMRNYLSGILNIPGNELQQLLISLNIPSSYPFSLSGLSDIYREALLIKATGLPVHDWLIFKSWLGSTARFGTAGDSAYNTAVNFAPLSPAEVIRLLTLIRQAQDAGITAGDIDYLLLDQMPDSIADNKLNDATAASITALRATLKALWSPGYDEAADGDGSGLLALLKKVTDEDKARQLVSIVQFVATAEPDFSANAATQLIGADLKFFLTDTTSASRLLNTVVVNTTTPPSNTPAMRRKFVFDQLDAYMKRTVLQPAIVSFFAKAYTMEEHFMQTLLRDCVQIENSATSTPPFISALNAFLNSDFIAEPDAHVISRWYTGTTVPSWIHPFRAALALQKALFLIQRFHMGEQDAVYFWQKSGVFPGTLRLSDMPLRTTAAGTPAPAKLSRLLNFMRWMSVRAFLGENAPLLYKQLEALAAAIAAAAAAAALAATPAAATAAAQAVMAAQKTVFLPALAAICKMGLADMEALLGSSVSMSATGSFGSPFGTPFQLPVRYLRIVDALEMQHLLPATMAVIGDMSAGIQSAVTQDDASKVTQVVKAQYDAQQWLSVIRPVNDQLRVERRDALVAYLLANPPAGYGLDWKTEGDIFETLLVDVEMMSCMATSRVLLAINTIQVWVDRVLLGLEKSTNVSGAVPLTMDKDAVRQWHAWRKRYRIWEANRKIFIYPENWIEPELRDRKTPIFLELEKFLKQNEVTDENVEQAYRTYLERLDELAHLDIIAVYRETTQTAYSTFVYDPDVTKRDVIHAFGRTPEHPHVYYYRRRFAEEWTPWEKMDVQIDGDHFVPVMWRGRLRFYWLTFMKDQLGDNGAKTRSKADFVTPVSTRWKINLAWTEYKDGRWTAKQLSKEALYSYPIEEENLTSIDHWNFFATRWTLNHEYRQWYPAGTMDRQVRERFYFYCTTDADDNLCFELNEKIVRNSTPLLGRHLITYPNGGSGTPVRNANLLMPAIGVDSDIPGVIAYIDEHESLNDWLPSKTGSFRVQFNTVRAQQTPFTGPNLYMPFELLSSGWRYSNAGLESYGYKGAATDFHYDHPSAAGYNHLPDYNLPLLANAPDTDTPRPSGKYLLFPREIPKSYVTGNILEIPYFFYKDYDNTFFAEKIIVPTAATTGGGSGSRPYPAATLFTRYRFHNFRHTRVNEFRKKLFDDGLDGLLDRTYINTLTDTISFRTTYKPTPFVDAGTANANYPANSVDFRYQGAFADYNWELFFHIPLLIANKLSQNRQFEAARKWYHYVFNPTVANSYTVANFWNIQPFYNEAANIPSIITIMQNPALQSAVGVWASDPFNPHLIARTRISAYMKNTVMKYLDNLIAWGDDLYRSDSREDIVEATLLYVLAGQLLGRPPVSIPARAKAAVQRYAMLLGGGTLNAFGNALVKIESLLMASGVQPNTAALAGTPNSMTYYFCIPPNDKLNGYWNTVADRLFKIRNCRNIDGVERDLALYDPPIDPALLVKAAAAGVSVADALAAANAPLPLYRFSVMSQKATELAGEVKALGGQLLAALEKGDAEGLALLRSSQEQKVLDAVTDLKEQGVEEAVAQINGLQQQRIMTTQRRDHYKELLVRNLIDEEQLQLDSISDNIPLHISKGITQLLASGLFSLPEGHFGPFNAGIRFGGMNLGNLNNVAAAVIDTKANINTSTSAMAATMGSFKRRREDWELQQQLADTELSQLDKQIIAAQIRQAMAERELGNHKLQVQNAAEMDEAMRGKYTNEELYDWMTGQISFSYFAAYQLAADVARRAERCYQNELNLPLAAFIGYGYWDSLHKGLLAGEQLSYDIKRMEVSYLEKNKRSLELSKHISLALLAPDKLTELKTSPDNSCKVDIPEWLFDLDYPGQHMRRIKSVSVSIPCVAGPYTTVSCKLSLMKSRYRKNTDLNPEPDPYKEIAGNDPRFQYIYGPIQSIATSSAQNDSGMFDFSFRDERYLPFEGAGAVSQWKIELPAAYAQFDYNSISDVILHINYNAVDDGSLLTAAKNYVTAQLSGSQSGPGFLQGFSLRRGFGNEWIAYGNTFSAGQHPLTVRLNEQSFPYFCHSQLIKVHSLGVAARPKPALSGDYDLYVSYRDDNGITTQSVHLALSNGMLTGAITNMSLVMAGNAKIVKLELKQHGSTTPVNMADRFDDLVLIAHATCEAPPASPPDSFPAANDADWSEVPQPPKGINLQGWWKSDLGITAYSTQATPPTFEVGGWADQSAKARHASAPTNANRPSYSNSVIECVRSQGAMLQLQAALNLGTTYTISIVCRPDAGLNCEIIGCKDAYGTGHTGYGLYLTSASTYDIYHNPDSSSSYFHIQPANAITTNVKCKFRIEREDHDFRLYQGNTLIGTDTISANPAFIIDNLFGESSVWGFVGGLYEIIIYNKVLDTDEVSTLNNYLNTTYNV